MGVPRRPLEAENGLRQLTCVGAGTQPQIDALVVHGARWVEPGAV